jgi:large subunit ribosomal protein L31e
MAKQNQEPKVLIEREYIVPLRDGWLKVPEYKRGNKAVKTLKEFLARHMKVYDRDLRKIKLSNEVNNEIRFRGMRKPPAKLKVKARKFDDGIVRVELVDLPVHVKFARLRQEKQKAALEKRKPAENKENEEVSTKKTDENRESEETKEKEQTSKESMQELAKQEARKAKHTSKEKPVDKQWSEKQRKTISRPGQ